jgi:hypothetical protein
MIDATQSATPPIGRLAWTITASWRAYRLDLAPLGLPGALELSCVRRGRWRLVHSWPGREAVTLREGRQYELESWAVHWCEAGRLAALLPAVDVPSVKHHREVVALYREIREAAEVASAEAG